MATHRGASDRLSATRITASVRRSAKVIGSASKPERKGPDATLGLVPGSLPAAMERFGFVGLPNAGKSSLYNALAGGGALAAPYAFATTDPNVGVAKVVDPRLDRLAEMSSSASVVPASVQFTDIGGLVEGASQGEGLGNKFLAGIRESDAIVFVLRAFSDTDVPGPSDPLEHLRVLEIELSLADLDSAENQFDKKSRQAKGDKTLLADVAALEAAVEALSAGTPIYRSGMDEAAREILKEYFLLTNKPVMAVVNIGDDQLDDVDEICAPVRAELDGAEVIGVCVQLEAEAVQLPDDERTEMLEGLGLGEGALPRFINAAYHILGLRTFLTTGEQESRAWTFKAGSTAPQCAGVIHTDFERGFIRAETIEYEKLLEAGSWSAARDLGQIRSEGKDYPVVDGDVMEFRFNV
jgi:GTP-binding protein YchF